MDIMDVSLEFQKRETFVLPRDLDSVSQLGLLLFYCCWSQTQTSYGDEAQNQKKEQTFHSGKTLTK